MSWNRAGGLSKHNSGFTLIELLVVLAIIAILIGLLIPMAFRARIQASHVKDQSNLHQMAVCCYLYAIDFHGYWPPGNRVKPNVSPPGVDDIRWIATEAFVQMLHYLGHGKIADGWLQSPSKPIPFDLKRQLCCVSELAAETTLDAEVGREDLKNDSVIPATMLGFNYWGGRDPALAGQLFQPDGTAVPQAFYQFMQKVTDSSTSRVLLSCPNYLGPQYFGSELPHCNQSEELSIIPADSSINSPHASMYRSMQGMFFAYSDGSVKWVPRSSLWSMHEGDNGVPGAGYQWVYFDSGTH